MGVILGNIVLPTERSSSFSTEVLGPLIEEGLGIAPEPSGPTDPLNAFPAGLPAALLARGLQLSGTAFTLGRRVCLIALCLEIGRRRASHRPRRRNAHRRSVAARHALHADGVFSASGPVGAGQPAPFDVNGDGLIVGEGAGFFVLKRLADALRQGDAIHALIRGIGLSNDVGADLLAPSSEGQLRAMRGIRAGGVVSPATLT